MDESNIVYNQNILPEGTFYFKEEEFSDIIVIPCTKPDIDKIISTSILPEVEDVQVISTEIGKSNEGQLLTGRKLLVKLNLKQKITYITNDLIQNTQTVYINKFKSVFVVLPNKYENQSVCDLIRLNKFIINPYVEYVNTRLLDKKTIFECVLLYVGIKLF